ncbi:hypothetical protein AV955_gp048 [Diadromus pulchellus ascovirus 4a]|uniref:Complete DpAV4 genome n=1 Tax=Diadromus pulchellus ascovirus 4a TaxID=158683 RepID=F2NYX7_9VIRU|nr:hypothetical protein AV955_gp048 [Diadromus pulchellus ascovirus 4a]CCA61405.1 unnamed protein product [Diadromus pulchellus ascovirus 4a]
MYHKMVFSDQINSEFYSKFDAIPDDFSWGIIKPSDSDVLKRKKSLMSEVKNQYSCGCCWAISCASAISDAYVVKELVDWNPRVSYTYALATYPQEKCSGGSGRTLLENIKDGGGIASDFCVDEDWCRGNSLCTAGAASDHFSTTDEAKRQLSKLVPASGCYDGTKKHFLYTVDDVYSMSVSNARDVKNMQTILKQHIMVRGPVIAGFLIMDDFPDGRFVEKGDGVYLEKSHGLDDDVFVYDPKVVVGSHSVVVLGWGKSASGVNYWHCRNSWGTKWGENGFFRLAMYPHNTMCQIEKRLQVAVDGVLKDVGGVTGFEVKTPPQLRIIRNTNVVPGRFATNRHLFFLDENLVVSSKSASKVSVDDERFAIIAVAGIMFAITALRTFSTGKTLSLEIKR